MDNRNDGKIWVLTGVDMTGRRVGLAGRQSRRLIREAKTRLTLWYLTHPRHFHLLQYKWYTEAEAAMLPWAELVPSTKSPDIVPVKNAAESSRTASPPLVRLYRRIADFLSRLIGLFRLEPWSQSLATRGDRRSQSSTEAGRYGASD